MPNKLILVSLFKLFFCFFVCCAKSKKKKNHSCKHTKMNKQTINMDNCIYSVRCD